MALSIAKGLHTQYTLQICGRNAKKAQDFITSNSLNATILDSTSIDIQDKIIILCIKPYGLANFQFRGTAKSVYSVLAGITISTLKQHLESKSFIRLMPNIAASLGLSSTSVFIENTDPNKHDEAKSIITSFGNAVFLDDEKLIDSSIATSGSSPAFLALMAQALIDSGVREGLKRSDSTLLVAQTFLGVAKLLESKSTQEIIDSITTPGGTTIEGLSILESRAFKGAIIEACHASVNKTRKKS